MTGKGIAKAFALIANVYGKRFDIPADPAKARLKAEVWADLLDDVPDDLGLAAFRAYCQAHGDWPPTPADVRELHRPTCSCPQLARPGPRPGTLPAGSATRAGACPP